MEIIKSLNSALDYIEDNLNSTIEIEEVAYIEKYFWDDSEYEKYTCEVWIPVERR